MAPEKTGRRVPDRRTFLKTCGAAVAAAGILSTTTTGSTADQYDSVIDVTDEGADPTGGESITPIIRDLVDDDTLLEFPPGRYYMDEQVRFTGIENFGMVGDDATLVPADYYTFDGPQYRLFRLGVDDAPVRNVRIENFQIDQRDTSTGIRAFHVVAADGLLVRDVDIVGRHDSGTWGPGLFRITDPGGSGLVERFRAPDGADWETTTPDDLWRGPTGILTNLHQGTLRFRDCVVNGFPDNGLYVSGSGTVAVDGGRFRNNGPVSVRIGADRGTIDGASFLVDNRSSNYAAQVPIRFDYANRADVGGVDIDMPEPNGDAIQFRGGVDGARVQNTDISIGDRPAVGVVVNSGVGPTSLENVDVDIESSANAVAIFGDDEGEVIVQGGRIAGSAPGDNLRHAIRCERDNCEFRGITMDQWGGQQRRGLALLGRDYTVYQCRFRTTDRPLTVHGDDVWVEDCDLDSYSGDESILLGSAAHSIRIKNNELPDGVADHGASDVTITGTTY